MPPLRRLLDLDRAMCSTDFLLFNTSGGKQNSDSVWQPGRQAVINVPGPGADKSCTKPAFHYWSGKNSNNNKKKDSTRPVLFVAASRKKKHRKHAGDHFQTRVQHVSMLRGKQLTLQVRFFFPFTLPLSSSFLLCAGLSRPRYSQPHITPPPSPPPPSHLRFNRICQRGK